MLRLFFLTFVFTLPFSPTLAIEFEDSPNDPFESDGQPESNESPESGDSPPDVFGDNFVPGFVCDVCRDPYEYPMDFVGVAYNALFGDDSWLFDSEIGWPFRIYNLQGEWVAVWFENILFDLPTLLPDTMTVLVRFENGQVLPYTVIQDGPDILVGPEPGSESDSTPCGCGGGDGGGADDEYEEPDDYEFEEPEYYGIVEIEDPDEDGEYPDWMEEL